MGTYLTNYHYEPLSSRFVTRYIYTGHHADHVSPTSRLNYRPLPGRPVRQFHVHILPSLVRREHR